MTFRKTVFWLHLLSGLVAGLVVFVMSFTGVAIAFEHEVLAWIDRDVRNVEAVESVSRLPVAELTGHLIRQKPDFEPSMVTIPREATRAYTFHQGSKQLVYVDPYTGDVGESQSGAADGFFHTLLVWHRFLGMSGSGRSVGKMINGVCNLAFLFLCISGLYLWFPKIWSARALGARLWFLRRARGRARDFNWHTVIGFWSLPVLILLVATAVVFSFGWANKLVFALAGESAPSRRGPPAQASAPVTVPEHPEGTPVLTYDDVVDRVSTVFPEAEAIAVRFPRPSSDESGGTSVKPLQVVAYQPALFASRGRVQVDVDPYSGEVLHTVDWYDNTPGMRARIWIRFLHTGEAFGLTGKIVAAIVTAASLLLVYTGFALSWRRFFGRRRAG